MTAWEDRLAGLEPRLTPVPPPETVWRGIETKLALRKLDRAPAMRWLAIAASILFFVMVGVFITRSPPAPQLAATQRALIQESPGTIYWRVELLGDNQELAIHAQAAHALDAEHALELWVLPAEGNPVSLGLLPAGGEARRVLTAAQRAALAGAKQLAVSLEPTGGSPTGLPTGPVLHVANLSRA